MATTRLTRRTARLAAHLIVPLFGAPAAGTAAAAPPELHESVVEISLNSPTGGEALVVLRDAAGHLWVEASDLARLRLLEPQVAAERAQGRRYFPLLAIHGSRLEVDDAAQHATLWVPPEALATTRLSATARREPGLTAADPGVFLNYQLSDQRIASNHAAGALLELGAFAAPGALTSTVVGRAVGGQRSAIRLDTTLTRDFPERLETLNLGDTISDPGSWGNAVRYAGVRFGRNFGIRPDLVTTPLLTAGGSAVVPSTVDVFVNSQRVASQPVPSGPFVVDSLPAMSGSGDVRVVVRDALGRQQVMTQSFYSGVNLLAAGLSQYSFDAGSIREDYAYASSRYGRLLGAATYRRGLSDALTLEGHAEYLAGDAHALGLHAAARTGRIGILTATLAGGGDARARGTLAGIGFEHRERGGSVVFSTQYASAGFRQVADTALVGARYKQRSVAQASASLGHAGSLSLADVVETFRDQPRLHTLSLTHNLSFGAGGALGLTYTRTSGASNANAVYLTWTMGLGAQRALTTTAIAGSGGGAPPHEVYATVLQNPPIGPGSGWRLGGTSAGNFDADWRGQYEPCDVEVESARTQGTSGASVFVRGAATLLDGDLRGVRAVNGSFAVVDVGGIANVPVYLDNQLVAHTDDRGRAVLHNLRAYEDNRISIDPQELPLDASIGARTVVLAPAFRSGVVARFPVERVHAATFRLVRDGGEAVPAGAVVVLNGSSFPTALDGIVYVTSLDGGRVGTASWGTASCRFELPPSADGDLLPDLGTVPCRTEAFPAGRVP
jgi:outer membrane usher protein